MAVGQIMTGLYQDSERVVNATAPATAPTGSAVEPEGVIKSDEIAGKPSSFLAHGVGMDDLGAYPRGGMSSGISNQDLQGIGASIVNPARAADGYELRGAGTPEPAINAPRQGAILDSRGIVHLGIGPGVPLALLAIIAGFLYLTRHKGSVLA